MLCRWCGSANHEDINCPKGKVMKLIAVANPKEEVLAILKSQTKKFMYPNPCTKKNGLKKS